MRKSLLVIQIYWGVGRWGTVGGSRWVGRKSFKSKTEKRNWVGGWEKIKFQKKKTEIRGWERANKKKSSWDGTGIEKRILSVHHPSTWCTGGCWFTLATMNQHPPVHHEG
jgi:hypothetical protein